MVVVIDFCTTEKLCENVSCDERSYPKGENVEKNGNIFYRDELYVIHLLRFPSHPIYPQIYATRNVPVVTRK
jgi:hypothetical protein